MPFQSPNYTQVPNDLFDEHMAHMGYAELKVVMAICRKTFGFHKERARISLRNVAKLTGLTQKSVLEGATAAEERGLIRRIQDGGVTLWEANVREEEDPAKSDAIPSIAPAIPSIAPNGESAIPSIAPSTKETTKETTKDIGAHTTGKGGRKAKQRPAPAAVEIVREVRERFPNGTLWPMIESTVGNDQQDLDRWRSILTKWLALGFNPANVEGPLNHFREHTMPGDDWNAKRKGGNGSAKNHTAVSRTGRPDGTAPPLSREDWIAAGGK